MNRWLLLASCLPLPLAVHAQQVPTPTKPNEPAPKSYVDSAVGTLTTSVGTLNSTVSTLTTDIGSINTTLGSLNSSVGNINTSIGTLNGSISTLTTDIGSIDSSLSGLNSSVGSINTSLGTLTSGQATLTTEIGTLNSNVSTLTTDIGSIESTLSGLNSSVGTINTSLGTLNSNVGALTTDIGTINGNVSALTTDIGTLNSNVSTLTADIGSIDTSLSGLNSSVGSINTSLGTLNTSLSALSGSLTTDIGTLNGNVSTLTADIGSIDTSLSGLNSSVGTINTSLGTLNTSVGVLNSSLATVNTEITGLNTSIGTLNTDIGTLTANSMLATGVNAVAAAVANMGGIGPVINVKNAAYGGGAILNGTSDDSTKLNLARAAAPADATLHVPPGGWLAATLNCPAASPVKWDMESVFIGTSTTQVNYLTGCPDTVHTFFQGGEAYFKVHLTGAPNTPDLRLSEDFNAQGGTVNLADLNTLEVQATVSRPTAAGSLSSYYVWALNGYCTFDGIGSAQDVCGAFTAFRDPITDSFGPSTPLWAMYANVSDKTNLPTSQAGALVSQELDLFAGNADDTSGRAVLHLAIGKQNPSFITESVATGLLLSSVDASYFETAINEKAQWDTAGISLAQGGPLTVTLPILSDPTGAPTNTLIVNSLGNQVEVNQRVNCGSGTGVTSTLVGTVTNGNTITLNQSSTADIPVGTSCTFTGSAPGLALGTGTSIAFDNSTGNLPTHALLWTGGVLGYKINNTTNVFQINDTGPVLTFLGQGVFNSLSVGGALSATGATSLSGLTALSAGLQLTGPNTIGANNGIVEQITASGSIGIDLTPSTLTLAGIRLASGLPIDLDATDQVHFGYYSPDIEFKNGTTTLAMWDLSGNQTDYGNFSLASASSTFSLTSTSSIRIGTLTGQACTGTLSSSAVITDGIVTHC